MFVNIRATGAGNNQKENHFAFLAQTPSELHYHD